MRARAHPCGHAGGGASHKGHLARAGSSIYLIWPLLVSLSLWLGPLRGVEKGEVVFVAKRRRRGPGLKKQKQYLFWSKKKDGGQTSLLYSRTTSKYQLTPFVTPMALRTERGKKRGERERAFVVEGGRGRGWCRGGFERKKKKRGRK